MISQVQIINKVLQTKDFSIITENNLGAEYFFDYTTEYNYLRKYYETYNSVPDTLTFLNAFPDFDITEVKEPDSYLLEQLYKDYQAHFLAGRFNNIKKLLESGKTDEAVDYFRKSVELMGTGTAVKCTDILRDTSRYDRYLEMASHPSEYFIKTGFKELDDIIFGIDRKNENMVIAARSGVGKTWCILKMVVAAAQQGLNVGLYSGEMSVDKVGYRIDTLLGHIKNSALVHGDLFVQKEYKEYIDSLKSADMGSIKVLTPNDISGAATVPALQAFVEKEKLDILFIDQYSLLEDTSHATKQFERVANISKAIKNLQVMKQIPIVSVSQMNRTKSEIEGEQDLTQIALSDRIGQDATMVIMLNRKDDDKLELNIVKSRDGISGKKLTYHVDINTGVFSYVNENPTEQEVEQKEAVYAQYDNGETGSFGVDVF